MIQSLMATRHRMQINLCVLCLGEEHTQMPADAMTKNTTVDVVRLAVLRAARLDRCVDIYIESGVDRGWFRNNQWIREHDKNQQDWNQRNRGNSLLQLDRVLEPSIPSKHQTKVYGRPTPFLDPDHSRVHAFDARPESGCLEERDMAMHLMSSAYYDPRPMTRRETDTLSANSNEWLLYLMGFDSSMRLQAVAPPPTLVATIRRLPDVNYFDVEQWIFLQERALRKIRKRAARLPLAACRLIASKLIDNLPFQLTMNERHPTLGMLFSSAVDFYTLVRMLAPYDNPRGSCGALPRCCIVYGGAAHTRNVAAVLASLSNLPYEPTRMFQHAKEVRVRDIQIRSRSNRNRVTTIDELLTRLGLPGTSDLPRQLTVYPPGRGGRSSAAEHTLRLFDILRGNAWSFSSMYKVRIELAAGARTVDGPETAIGLAVEKRRPEIMQDIITADRRGLPKARRLVIYERALETAEAGNQHEAARILRDEIEQLEG
jgi:hypothetical protein